MGNELPTLLAVALNVPIVQAAQGLVQTAQTVGKSKSDRVNAMAAANAGWQAYQTGKSAQNLANGTTNANQVSISITYGEQKNQQTTQIQANQAQASQIQAGGKTTLIATGAAEQSNITITGSDVAGKASTTLIADSDITHQSADQTHTERSNNKSSGWNAGVKIAYENGKPVLGITAGGNIGKGYGNGDSITHRHSHIGDSSSQTTIQSGSNTTIKGVQVIGRGVQVNAKNLSIQSVQDSETYQSKQQNAGAQVTVGYGASASGDYSQSKINADYASVNEQSGIFAGENGYQINVQNHTDLKGGLITSTQSAEDKGKNQFSTGTLAHSDIENHSQYKGESFGLGASVAVSGKTLGQGEQNNPQESHLKTVADKNGTSSSIGYGNDSDSQSSVTRSGINTQNIRITDEAKQIQLTGKTAEQSKADIYTDTNTDTAEQHSGSLKNVFDKDRVQSELDLQREVTQEFAPLMAQGIANVSEWLGNTNDYQKAQVARDYLQTELTQTTDPQKVVELTQALNQVDTYLANNQTRYQLFQEGGIGRAVLHTIGGGILTGDISGAVGAGTTSLAAPVIQTISDNSGSLKPVVDTVGGLAIGYATGGNAGAFTGVNADWNNRQLHPSEYKKAEEYAKIIAKHLGISREEALGRIVRHMLRTVDYETAKADDFRIDQAIISLLGANNLPKRDEHYYNPNYNAQYNQNYARDLNLGRQNAHSGKTPAEIKTYNKGVVTDIFKAAGNTAVGLYESAANAVTGEIFPESKGYVHINRPFEYTHDEYGNALENTMTLGVAAITAGRGVEKWWWQNDNEYSH